MSLAFSRRSLHALNHTWKLLHSPKTDSHLKMNDIVKLLHSKKTLMGGDPIIAYKQKFTGNIQQFLNTYGQVGTIGIIHSILEGPFAGKTVLITSYYNIVNNNYFYCWYGEKYCMKIN